MASFVMRAAPVTVITGQSHSSPRRPDMTTTTPGTVQPSTRTGDRTKPAEPVDVGALVFLFCTMLFCIGVMVFIVSHLESEMRA